MSKFVKNTRKSVTSSINSIGNKKSSQSKIFSDQSLRLTIVAAKNVAGVDNGGTSSDPYVIIDWPGQPKQRTSVVQETLTPLWEETFLFPVYGEPPPSVMFVIKDDNLVDNNVLLGVCQFDLIGLTPNQEKTMWLPVESQLAPNTALQITYYYDTTQGAPDLKEAGQLMRIAKSVTKKTKQVTQKAIQTIIAVCMDILIFSARLILCHLERKKWRGFVEITIEMEEYFELEFQIGSNPSKEDLERRLGKLAEELGFEINRKLDKYEDDDDEDIEELEKEVNAADKEDHNKNVKRGKLFCYKLADMLLLCTKESCLHMQKRDAHGVLKIKAKYEVPLLVSGVEIRYGFAVDTDSVHRDDLYVEPGLLSAADAGPMGFYRAGIKNKYGNQAASAADTQAATMAAAVTTDSVAGMDTGNLQG